MPVNQIRRRRKLVQIVDDANAGRSQLPRHFTQDRAVHNRLLPALEQVQSHIPNVELRTGATGEPVLRNENSQAHCHMSRTSLSADYPDYTNGGGLREMTHTALFSKS